MRFTARVGDRVPTEVVAAPSGWWASRSPSGLSVNALTSVSLEPPLVVVALDRRRFITPSVHETGRYAVNVLSEDQQMLSDCFAGAAVTPDRDAFCGAAWTPGPTGLPLIDGYEACRRIRARRPRIASSS